jgi:hypothetical protein
VDRDRFRAQDGATNFLRAGRGAILFLLFLLAVFAPRPDYERTAPQMPRVAAPQPATYPVSAVDRDGCWKVSDGSWRCMNQMACPQDRQGFPDCRGQRPMVR